MALRALPATVEAARRRAAGRAVHDERTASILGVALGVAFTVCLLTGLWSHLQQHPPAWLDTPVGPAGLYRVTQGVHVAAGMATVPLLLAKLYAVSPALLQRPPVRGVAHALERLALLPLVGGSIFLLATGIANTAHWYPWRFSFPLGHWWAAWLVVGALVVHVALQAATARRALGRRPAGGGPDDDAGDDAGGEPTGGRGPDRRELLWTVAIAAGLITVTTAGQTAPVLRRTTLLAPRRPDIGPQGFPVNRTASAAGTLGLADDPDYRLVVASGREERAFSLAELRALPQRTAELPIACVEGWSASRRWTGVPVADVLAAAGMAPGEVDVRSAQRGGSFASSRLSASAVADPRCLLALLVEGEPLHPDHGAPLRLIAPNRPGVLQTKWVTRLVLA